jgi:hypothetical protein
VVAEIEAGFTTKTTYTQIQTMSICIKHSIKKKLKMGTNKAPGGNPNNH